LWFLQALFDMEDENEIALATGTITAAAPPMPRMAQENYRKVRNKGVTEFRRFDNLPPLHEPLDDVAR